MKLSRLQRTWNELGRRDPFWAVLAQDDKRGNRWNEAEFFQTGRDEIAALIKYIDSLGRQIQRKRALDFGCGVGRLTQPLADYFDEVVGIDIAPAMLDIATARNQQGARCQFIHNERDDLEVLASGTFDLIYSRFVLQHMQPRHVRAYLPEFVRVLAPGGLLIFQLPGGDEPPVIGGTVKRLLPLAAIKALRRVRRRLAAFPAMEEHGMASEVVLSLLRGHGAVLVDVTPDRSHGADTDGFRYCFSKA